MDGVTYQRLHGACLENIEEEGQSLQTAAMLTMTTVEPVQSPANTKLSRRVQLLEHQVKDLSGQLAVLREAGSTSRLRDSTQSMPNLWEVANRTSTSTTTTNPGQDKDRESMQFAFFLQNIEHLTAHRLNETDDLMNYCATFKATADGIPNELLGKELRREIFLDPLPERVKQAVARRCESGAKDGDFDGLFIVAAEVVREVQGFGWKGGGGCWNEFNKESASETDLRSWLRLKDEMERAWDGHVRFLATRGRKVRIRRVY